MTPTGPTQAVWAGCVRPLFVYMTYRCNWHCAYCFVDATDAGPLRSYVVENWPFLAANAVAAGVTELRLGGGEPLLVPRLRERCAVILEAGLDYTLVTNGARLRRHLDWLAVAPPGTLWLSHHLEYRSERAWLMLVAAAARALPCVGVNIFARDVVGSPGIVERSVAAGAARVKILDTSPLGRAAALPPVAPVQLASEHLTNLGARSGVEIRLEAPCAAVRSVGPASCVLRERPLPSVSPDGAVYACCATLGVPGAFLGHLASAPLHELLRRVPNDQTLPCRGVLPDVADGRSPCPLRVVTLSTGGETFQTRGR